MTKDPKVDTYSTKQSFAVSDQRTSRGLLKTIFDSESPELLAKQLPAQSIYLVLKQSGLQSCTDLIDITPIETLRTCLDFDLWEKDRFNEENFWEWLALSDDEDPLKFTQKILRSIDLKLVAYLIVKYVEILMHEEATDQPPGPNFYTPDRGFTWLSVTIEDGTKHFLFTRFLALLFETNAKLFYQLIAVPGVSNLSLLEEESFQERGKRLSAEGVPELDFAQEIHTPLLPHEVQKIIHAPGHHEVINDIAPVSALFYDNVSVYQPLHSLLSELASHEEVEAEITLIINASIVFFSIPFYEYEFLLHHVERVKGALNLGLEHSIELGFKSAFDAYDTLGLQKLYRLGLYHLFELRKTAHKIKQDEVKNFIEDKILFSVTAHARQAFPETPLFIGTDGSIEQQQTIQSGSRGIGYLAEIRCITKILQDAIERVQES